MPRYVAFLRAINVGGRVVKMEQLKKLFERMGLSNVKTFIASGNVIFDSPSKNTATLEKKIAAGLESALGYEVAVFIRTPEEVAQIAARQPFKASAIGGSLFVGLLAARLDARDRAKVASLRTPVDDLHAHDREVYWRATKNFRDAQFSPARLEKTLGAKATFRNVTTIRKIAAICTAPESPKSD